MENREKGIKGEKGESLERRECCGYGECRENDRSRESRENNRELVVLLALVAACVAGAMLITLLQPNPQNEYDGIIRFHVIANSNSKSDQELKLKVRDNVMANISEQLCGSTNVESVRSYIEDNKLLIESWAEETIREAGCSYDVDVALGIVHIPVRQYGDVVFPEGNYEALTVTIGEGKGRNWWCVIFPPLCMVGKDKNDREGAAVSTGPAKLILKSRIKELLKNKSTKSA